MHPADSNLKLFIMTIFTTMFLQSHIRHVSSFQPQLQMIHKRNIVKLGGSRRSSGLSCFGGVSSVGNTLFSKLNKTSKPFIISQQNQPYTSSSYYHTSNFKSSTGIFMSTEEDTDTESKTTYNLPELKKEASRLTLRCHKKIGKASTRLAKANDEVEEIRTNPDATLEQLESCPNIKVLEDELDALRIRLKSLNVLEEKLQKVKSGKAVELPEDVLSLVLELDVKDEAPKRQERPPKKKKGPRTVAPRLPYFRYYTENNTEIRVSF